MNVPAREQPAMPDPRSHRQPQGEEMDRLAATDTPGAPAEGVRPAITLEGITVTEFIRRHSRETWRGFATAFGSGVKARVFNRECGYFLRQDFRAAWERGYAAMDEYLAVGGLLVIEADRPKRKWSQKVNSPHVPGAWKSKGQIRREERALLKSLKMIGG